MEKVEKSTLTSISKIKEFNEVLRKITMNEQLKEEEKTYILSCAILFMKHYEADQRFSSYLEFAYYIILKYSVQYEDYMPLYDFAVNFGFYPIAKDIINFKLLGDQLSLNDSLMEVKIDSFRNHNYIETYQQKKVRTNLLKDNSSEVSYIAPTSFGKSSLIIEHILHNESYNKIAIIVPTKSLLVQTYREVRNSKIDKRILIHDEMYQGDDSFIAIFTQERALRLLDKNNVYFDIMYIDEAHNLFGKDNRNILLSRLIRKNRNLNPSQKTVYLSPLIFDSNNLRLDKQQDISEQRISYNLKEAELYEYRLSGDAYQYNRFVNEFYPKNFKGDFISYIKLNKGNKNFIYIKSPKKIEMFVKEFANRLNPIVEKDIRIQELIKELEDFVHKDFHMITLLSKGVVYLHGKIPDIVKEYIEYKFKEISNLQFLVANSVILEGINLPIDTLFILNTHNLRGKELTNLIGRVNRLNNVFNGYSNQIHKLLPPIHFVNSEVYNRLNSKMESKIRSLRSNLFEDRIENPVLESFDIDKLKIDKNNRERIEEKFNTIKENEELIFTNEDDEESVLKRYLVNVGLQSVYDINNNVFLEQLLGKINSVNKEDPIWLELNIIDKIYMVFIEGLEDFIIDFEFARLSNPQARNYYKMYYLVNRKNTLKENIHATFNYFKRRIREGNSLFYMGNSYGEVSKQTESYQENGKEVYVDLLHKTDAEIINLAIVKLKIEEDFVNYHLNKLVVSLYDLSLISQEEYHLTVYGTNDDKKINLIKTGLSLNLISRLHTDNQLNNINLDINNNLVTNSHFEVYRNSIQGFYRFELDKFL
ncbi:DEAD/DEAH box helicase [Bacillus thuringiensis]|uniref:DEAD/DEAH box helicase n=1 Tax=Bacillus thuringiensis TaxID=1428 RepID=UPI000BF2F53B|nr:DEAD/DEAH box helicase [Bacillus thuringiensis]MED3052122.1 DEAD/DEAH box helicase [Bacillus thuringiensis]PFH71994.1 DNA helicase [Bacillus thuringiensis]